MSKLVTATILLLSLLATANAADDQLVREYLKKTGFRDGIEQKIRASSGTFSPTQRTQFINSIDFKKIEQKYIQQLSASMSNDEVRTLIQAHDLPGFQSATQKQSAASVAVIEVIVSELKNAGHKIDTKNK